MQKHRRRLAASNPPSTSARSSTPRGLTSGWSNPTQFRWFRSNSPCAAERRRTRRKRPGLQHAAVGHARRGRGRPRFAGFQQALDEKAVEIHFRNDRDHHGRADADADQKPRPRRRASPPRAQRAALRRGAVHPGARARQCAPAPRRQRSRNGRGARLAGERLPRPPIRAAGRRHARDAGAGSSGPTWSPRRSG